MKQLILTTLPILLLLTGCAQQIEEQPRNLGDPKDWPAMSLVASVEDISIEVPNDNKTDSEFVRFQLTNNVLIKGMKGQGIRGIGVDLKGDEVIDIRDKYYPVAEAKLRTAWRDGEMFYRVEIHSLDGKPWNYDEVQLLSLGIIIHPDVDSEKRKYLSANIRNLKARFFHPKLRQSGEEGFDWYPVNMELDFKDKGGFHVLNLPLEEHARREWEIGLVSKELIKDGWRVGYKLELEGKIPCTESLYRDLGSVKLSWLSYIAFILQGTDSKPNN